MTNPGTVESVGHQEHCNSYNNTSSHFILQRVRRIAFLLLATEDVKVFHEATKEARDSNARENAHDRGQHQHQTHHHTLKQHVSQSTLVTTDLKAKTCKLSQTYHYFLQATHSKIN